MSSPLNIPVETFSEHEEEILARFFTNSDKPVFALFNLPESVKGALFARYSRSNKSLRRLFLDEFYDHEQLAGPAAGAEEASASGGSKSQRASDFYQRVLDRYGDDSVAQLGAAHIAFEGISNILTKVVERGRLASYLEQSTRYLDYGNQVRGRFRYVIPAELLGSELEGEYVLFMDGLFDFYNQVKARAQAHFKEKFASQKPENGDAASQKSWERSIQAQAFDLARAVLPASTYSNVGVFASGQAMERLLLRLMSSELAEARECGELALAELRRVIPDFLRRVDVADRGVLWANYLRDSKLGARELTAELTARGDAFVDDSAEPAQSGARLVSFDADGESKILAAILYESSNMPLVEAAKRTEMLSEDERAGLIERYCGSRSNRRHMPGRAFEATDYKFDVLSDYGAFRDMQRHRMLTIDWQYLGVASGYVTPDDVPEMGLAAEWDGVMQRTAGIYQKIAQQHGPLLAQYVVPFGYRIRYTIKSNARELFHLFELRSTEQAHAACREIVHQMYAQIGEKAGHGLVLGAMKFMNLKQGEQPGRLTQLSRSQSRQLGFM